MTQKLWFVNMLMQTSCDTRTLAKVGLWLIGSVWMPAQAVEHCHQNWPNRNKAVLQSSCDIWSGANVGPVAHAGVFLLKGNKQEQCSLNAIFLWHMVPCQSRPSGARRRYVLQTMELGRPSWIKQWKDTLMVQTSLKTTRAIVSTDQLLSMSFFREALYNCD